MNMLYIFTENIFCYSLTTKQKILHTATKLFNQSGYSAINLLDIAKDLDMSRGNLTYHFKTKDDLLLAIFDEMWKKINVERNKTRSLPSFENISNEIQLYFKYNEEYAFIFQDPYVLHHPVVNKQFKESARQFIHDNKLVIAFSISIGNFQKEEVPGTYNNLAYLTWFISFFWYKSNEINTEYNKLDGEKIIWNLIRPYFTEKGIKSFKKYFGEDYFKSISEPFEDKLSAYMPF